MDSVEASPMPPALVAALKSASTIPVPRAEIGITSYTVFSQSTVQNLTETDFILDGAMKVECRNKECMLILFYAEDSNSHELCGIWGLAASQAAGPQFAACNLSANQKVKKSFVALGSDPSHLLKHFALKQVPFILVYRKGLPKAFYNGDLSSAAITDYSLTLACHPDYHEEFTLGGSMSIRTSLGMPRPPPVGDRVESSDYKTFQPGMPRSPPVLPTPAVVGGLPSVSSFIPSKYGQPIGGLSGLTGNLGSFSGLPGTGLPSDFSGMSGASSLAGLASSFPGGASGLASLAGRFTGR